ncbi:MAG TPA: hypothetical protein VF881_00140 [Polyangiaceae bacterium]
MSTFSRGIAAHELNTGRGLLLPFAVGAGVATVLLVVQGPWPSLGSRAPSAPRIVAIETAPLESSPPVQRKLDWEPPPPPVDEPVEALKRAPASVPPTKKNVTRASPPSAPTSPASKESPPNVFQDRT